MVHLPLTVAYIIIDHHPSFHSIRFRVNIEAEGATFAILEHLFLLLLLPLRLIEMASLTGKFIRVNKSICRVSSRSPSFTTVQLTRRCLATSSCLRFRSSPRENQLAEVPADKYQRTTITEDVRRAASRENWPDPRGVSSNEQKVDEDMIDPTIRHFTVNFVPSLPAFKPIVLTPYLGSTASSCSWCTSVDS